jgi:hypothetical protein
MSQRKKKKIQEFPSLKLKKKKLNKTYVKLMPNRCVLRTLDVKTSSSFVYVRCQGNYFVRKEKKKKKKEICISITIIISPTLKKKMKNPLGMIINFRN